MEFDSDTNDASKSKWLQMSSSPLDLNKNVWDSPTVPRSQAMFDSYENADMEPNNETSLPSAETESLHGLSDSENCVDDLTAGSVASTRNLPQPNDQTSEEPSVFLPSTESTSKASDIPIVTEDKIAPVSGTQVVDHSAQSVWGTLLSEENQKTTLSDTESDSASGKAESTDRHLPHSFVVTSPLFNKPAGVEPDPWSVTANCDDSASPRGDLDDEKKDKHQSSVSSNTSEPDNQETSSNNHQSASNESSPLGLPPNIFPDDLQSIMDSIYETEKLDYSENLRSEKSVESIFDYGKDSRRYYNALTRPTRQFLQLNSNDSDDLTNGLNHIVAWKNSNTEKELNAVISNWNKTENSSFTNSIRLKENAYISMFGWSTSINYSDKVSSNVAASLAEQKETTKEKLKRLAEEGANKLIKQRLEKEAIKLEADKKMDEFQRNCNGPYSQNEILKGKRLLEAEREKNMIELKRLTSLAKLENADNDTSKRSNNDSNKKSKPTSKKLLPRFFGFNNNSENSKKLPIADPDEVSNDNPADFEFSLDDNDIDNDKETKSIEKDSKQSKNDQFSSIRDLNNDAITKHSMDNSEISSTQSSQTHFKDSLKPSTNPRHSFFETDSIDYKTTGNSNPLIPIAVLQPKRNSMVNPSGSQSRSSTVIPVLSTSVLQPKRNSLAQLTTPIDTVSSSVLQPKRPYNNVNNQSSSNTSNGSASIKKDILNSMSIFETAPGSHAGSVIPKIQSTQNPQSYKIQDNISAQSNINFSQTKNEDFPVPRLPTNANDNNFLKLRSSSAQDGINIDLNSSSIVSETAPKISRPKTFSTIQVLTPKKVGTGLGSLNNINLLSAQSTNSEKSNNTEQSDEDDEFGDFAAINNSGSNITNIASSHIRQSTNTRISLVPLTPEKNMTLINQRSGVLVPSIISKKVDTNDSTKDDDDDFGDFTSTSNFGSTSNLKDSGNEKQQLRQLVNTIPNMDSFL